MNNYYHSFLFLRMILIVDDKHENIISLRRVLEKNGFEVDSATSGEEALKKVLKKSYVLIILDVQMPDMDGFEVAKAISGFSKAKDTAIIFLSAASTESRFITQGYSAGGQDYITKPVETDILLLKVKTFYKIYEQNRTLNEMKLALLAEIEIRKDAESKKDEFISIASHELKTPLTSVKGYLQLLERTIQKGDVDKIKNQLHKAQTQVERLSDLVADLLDISKIESGEMKFNMQLFSMDSLVNDVIETIQQINPEIHVTRKGKIENSIYGDEMRLEQVISNFLTNAIKYAPNSKEVIVTTKMNEEKLYISVRDFGIGMPEEHLQKVFKKFYRVEESSLRFQGLGIGLFISKQIVERHGGKIGVLSKVGEGSEFFFELDSKQAKQIAG